MLVLAIMGAGLLVGAFCFPKKGGKVLSLLQTASVVVLIFLMGLTLGSRPDFLTEISTLGLTGLTFALLTVAFSALLCFLAARLLFGRDEKGDK